MASYGIFLLIWIYCALAFVVEYKKSESITICLMHFPFWIIFSAVGLYFHLLGNPEFLSWFGAFCVGNTVLFLFEECGDDVWERNSRWFLFGGFALMLFYIISNGYYVAIAGLIAGIAFIFVIVFAIMAIVLIGGLIGVLIGRVFLDSSY